MSLPQDSVPAAAPEPPGATRWKGLIKVGYACNNHCTFCHTLELRDVDGTGPLVMRKIDRAKQLGYSMVVLSGGEVTMRRELLLWAARSAALGMDFGLVTNGRMLAYPDLVAKLIKLRLRYVYLSLHGGTARVHNSLVRAEAFDETLGAIRNLSARGLDFTVNTVVTRQNLAALRGVVDLLLPFPDLTLKFSMVQPKGGGDRAFDSLVPGVADAGAQIRDAIAYGLMRVHNEGRGPRFAHDGVPLCLLPEYADLYDDLQTHGFAAMTEAFEPDFFPVDDADKIQPEPCRGCALAGPCPGLYRGTHELRGADDLKPMREGTRSNSFSYTPERALPCLDASAPQGGCPVYASPLPWHRGRHLLLDEGQRLVVHHTRSRDLAEIEITRIKERLGQVYLDRSDKPAPDDFARDLAKLRPSSRCEGCDQRVRCTGAWTVEPGDPFGVDDAAVRAWIREIGGAGAPGKRVLDVGCGGDGRYDDEWARFAGHAGGALRYLGVDPDPARAQALAAKWPWAEVRAQAVEDLPAEVLAEGIDAVLVLRSWNHLADPRAALGPAIGALGRSGLLVIADNVAFGLVRSHQQQARAERSRVGFEHHRNDESHDALAALAPLVDEGTLALVEHRPVHAGGSNQWLLVFRRA